MTARPAPAARPASTVLVLALGLALGLPAAAQEAVDGRADAQTDVAPPADDPAHPATAAESMPAAMQSAAAGTEPDQDVGTTPPTDPALPPDSTTPTDDAPATTEPAADAADGPAGSEPTPDADTPTAAEDDFEALYGESDTADGAPVAPTAYDPWERYNRRMHRFNNAVDQRVARPLAQAYVRAVPAPVRGGVSNFFSNLGQPVSAVNALLQGKPKQAAHSLGRFVLNSTLGIGGIFDPASAAKLDNRSEDFGQTLGVWGWKRSRYVELPLFGPRTLRDVLGMAGDSPLSPLRQVDADRIRVPLQGMQLVDLRAQLLSTDALREGVEDDYALVRDAWSQRRDYQIFGDRSDDQLPDYLREEPTVVPVDAMPVGGG